jgi:hypothetical protein
MKEQNADFLIHINEDLSTDQIHHLENIIATNTGIQSVCVNNNHRHLMMVDYDPEEISSQTILNCVKNNGLHAQLVGL